jgi:hypothetical protein
MRPPRKCRASPNAFWTGVGGGGAGDAVGPAVRGLGIGSELTDLEIGAGP